MFAACLCARLETKTLPRLALVLEMFSFCSYCSCCLPALFFLFTQEVTLDRSTQNRFTCYLLTHNPESRLLLQNCCKHSNVILSICPHKPAKKLIYKLAAMSKKPEKKSVHKITKNSDEMKQVNVPFV